MEETIVPNTCPSSSLATVTPASIISNNKKSSPSTSLERKVRPQKEQALNCPRCNSTHTKFCYYNNYSLSQPRYFCKTCRRYWTEGGSLRNIPVGGGSRKNKRPSSAFSSSSKLPHHLVSSQAQSVLNSNPKIQHHHHHQGQDLNLGFPPTLDTHVQKHEFRSLSDQFVQLPTFRTPTKTQIPNSSLTTSANVSALELLNGFTCSRGLALAPFTPIAVPNGDPNVIYSSGLPLHDFKPTLNFTLDGIPNHGYGNLQQEETTNSGRLLFPFEDLKPVSSNTSTDVHNDTTTTPTAAAGNEINREQGNSTGYWTGLLGTGASW